MKTGVDGGVGSTTALPAPFQDSSRRGGYQGSASLYPGLYSYRRFAAAIVCGFGGRNVTPRGRRRKARSPFSRHGGIFTPQKSRAIAKRLPDQGLKPNLLV